jgi:hypothetical protein
LPWIPASQFDGRCEQSPLCAPIHQLDDWLRNECFNENNEFCFTTLEDYYVACIRLLDSLSANMWQMRLLTAGFSPTQSQVVLSEQQLFSLGAFEKTSPLLQQYARVEEDDEYEEEPQENLIQTLRIPLGCDKQSMIQSVQAEWGDDFLIIDQA